MNQKVKKENQNTLSNFFPRIIREFEEKDEPLIYAGH